MFKSVLNDGSLTHFAVWGLVIFVVVFLGVAVWVLTRPRKTIRRWSSIPLDEGVVDPRATGQEALDRTKPKQDNQV